MCSPLEKVGDHIGFGLSVCMYVCLFVRDIILKLHVWIPPVKIADTYYFFPELSPLVKLWSFVKHVEIL